MKRILILFCIIVFATVKTDAQVKLNDIMGQVDNLLGKKSLLTVKKGFNPVFKLGNLQINKNGILGEKLKGVEVLGTIFKSKAVQDIAKLYKTYKTGLVVYKILAAAGTAASVYSAVRGVVADNKFSDKTVKALLLPGVTSLLSGVITKVLTKKASYKAVDLFNGIVKKKIKDIISVAPASTTTGIGVYVKL